MTSPYPADPAYPAVDAYVNPPVQAPEPQCRFCGCVPAVYTKFRGHRGMIVLMQYLSLEGPFCRNCGLATFRRMTSHTLIQGWYGYVSFVVTPVTVLINLVRSRKVLALDPPRPPLNGPSAEPADPGAPLFMRPLSIIGLGIPFVLVTLIVILVNRPS